MPHSLAYQVAGLITRGQALAAQQRCREALSDLCLAVDLSRPTGDPALLLRAAAARLALDGDGDLAAEARAAATQIAAALPDDECVFASPRPSPCGFWAV